MKAMILKEFRQMRRDRRTVALMVGLPLLLLIIFGYAARFDVTELDAAVVGPGAVQATALLSEVFDVVELDPSGTEDDARDLLRNSEASIALVAEPAGAKVLIDGTQLFVAQSALRRIPPEIESEVLFNPELDTATVMVPRSSG